MLAKPLAVTSAHRYYITYTFWLCVSLWVNCRVACRATIAPSAIVARTMHFSPRLKHENTVSRGTYYFSTYSTDLTGHRGCGCGSGPWTSVLASYVPDDSFPLAKDHSYFFLTWIRACVFPFPWKSHGTHGTHGNSRQAACLHLSSSSLLIIDVVTWLFYASKFPSVPLSLQDPVYDRKPSHSDAAPRRFDLRSSGPSALHIRHLRRHRSTRSRDVCACVCVWTRRTSTCRSCSSAWTSPVSWWTCVEALRRWRRCWVRATRRRVHTTRLIVSRWPWTTRRRRSDTHRAAPAAAAAAVADDVFVERLSVREAYWSRVVYTGLMT